MEKTDKQAGKQRRRVLRDSKRAKKLYLRGYTRDEIIILFGRSAPTIDRYFQYLGGITQHDKAMHYKNKYILMLPAKDRAKKNTTPN